MTNSTMEHPAPNADSEPGVSVASASPTVRVVVTPVDGADLDAALAAIRRQAYDRVVDVAVVSDGDVDIADASVVGSLEAAIADTPTAIDYFWILHADARPRPDALKSLVNEVERHDAGLGASKLLKAGTRDELEAIGSATDVFGEPYSGLDAGEVDLQQYDVVREVAYVDAVSMLVRRDLARGLGGLDTSLPTGAAGLDFSQRARLAGGTVIIVPSSEVYHQRKCVESGRGWKERAGRMRAMIISYRALTLIWFLPLTFLVGFLDSILNLLLLRWKPLASWIATWLWNLYRLPSTISQRRKANAIRSVGDEELFRYQTAGSVRLRAIGDEFTALALALFDDDQALTRGARRIWGSPGILGAVAASILMLLAVRGVIFGGVPNVGYSFPFEPPTFSLGRFLGGWNEASLGTPAPVHPIVGFTGLASLIWFGAEGAARTLLTIALGFIAVAGMGRLLGRLGLRGPGRYLAGLVAIAGPGTALLAGVGSWSALAGAAFLPWALRAVFVHPAERARSRWGQLGWALVAGWSLAAISPLLLLVPVLAVAICALQGGKRARWELAMAVGFSGVVAVSFLSGDPGWLLDAARRIGFDTGILWAGLILVTSLSLVMGTSRLRRIAVTGALMSLGGLLGARLEIGGPGVEEAALVAGSVGAAIVVAAALDRFERKTVPIVATLGATAMVLFSVVTLAGGNLGLPSGDVNDSLSFAETLTDDGQARRILYVSTERDQVPTEAKSGPGLWYRVLDGGGTTTDEVVLPEDRAGDEKLSAVLEELATGSLLRPGQALAEFGIGWIVSDGPENAIDAALTSQLDVLPLPLDSAVRVYENPEAVPLAIADTGNVWVEDGLGFRGDAGSGRVAISSNFTTGWDPNGGEVDWYTSVAASTGTADYSGHVVNIVLGYLALAVLLIGIGLIIWARRPQ